MVTIFATQVPHMAEAALQSTKLFIRAVLVSCQSYLCTKRVKDKYNNFHFYSCVKHQLILQLPTHVNVPWISLFPRMSFALRMSLIPNQCFYSKSMFSFQNSVFIPKPSLKTKACLHT